jgi:hypothetical protein
MQPTAAPKTRAPRKSQKTNKGTFIFIFIFNHFPKSKTNHLCPNRLPEFKLFCEQAFIQPRCRLLELDSFLIAPLQRVCKYPLLLKARQFISCIIIYIII